MGKLCLAVTDPCTEQTSLFTVEEIAELLYGFWDVSFRAGFSGGWQRHQAHSDIMAGTRRCHEYVNIPRATPCTDTFPGPDHYLMTSKDVSTPLLAFHTSGGHIVSLDGRSHTAYIIVHEIPLSASLDMDTQRGAQRKHRVQGGKSLRNVTTEERWNRTRPFGALTCHIFMEHDPSTTADTFPSPCEGNMPLGSTRHMCVQLP